MYFNHREELTILDNMILKGVCFVIPKSLRSEMKKLLHTGHLGIEKTRQLARSNLYWPDCSHEIAEMISGCEICLENQNKQCKEPIIKHEIPATPWFKVGTDVFHLRGKDYIIVVDYNSNFFDISKMNDAQGPTVVTHTKQIFSRYGSPKEVISDKSPEFKSKEYKKFAREWDFEHNPSSPIYPESNGLVERTIQTVKRTLCKAYKAGEDPHLALLALRTAPGPNNGNSPAKIMFSRQPRTVVPSVVKASSMLPAKTSKMDMRLSARTLPELKIGDKVRLYKDKQWKVQGTIFEKCQQPRSYIVLTRGKETLKKSKTHQESRCKGNARLSR